MFEYLSWRILQIFEDAEIQLRNVDYIRTESEPVVCLVFRPENQWLDLPHVRVVTHSAMSRWGLQCNKTQSSMDATAKIQMCMRAYRGGEEKRTQ